MRGNEIQGATLRTAAAVLVQRMRDYPDEVIQLPNGYTVMISMLRPVRYGVYDEKGRFAGYFDSHAAIEHKLTQLLEARE